VVAATTVGPAATGATVVAGGVAVGVGAGAGGRITTGATVAGREFLRLRVASERFDFAPRRARAGFDRLTRPLLGRPFRVGETLARGR